jgi:superfamily II DNA or RNA helicase
MIHIKIDNVKTKISGLEEQQLEDISLLLSFEVQGAEHIARAGDNHWALAWDGRKRLMRKNVKAGSGTFPTGLMPRVIAFLMENKLKYDVTNDREKPEPIHSFKDHSGFLSRDYQTEITDLTEKRDRGVVVLATGGGKSYVAGKIIEQKQVDTLFIAPNVGLREQMLSTLRAMFGEKNVSSKITDDAPIIVSNIDAVYKKPEKFFKRFGLLMIDEFHHASSESYLTMNQKCVNAYHRYGMTGSFCRPDGTDMIMHGVLSNVIYEKYASDLIREGWLVRPHIMMIDYEFKKIRSKSYRAAYDLAITNDVVNDKIAELAHNKAEDGKQVLILVRRKEHGEDICRRTKGATFVHGSIKPEKREEIKESFKRGEISIIVATSVFGEGTDIPNIDVLINARYQASEIETVQGIGRALRTTDGKNIYSKGYEGKTCAEIYDFILRGNKHLQNHSIARLRTYGKEKEYAINKINLEDFYLR